MQAPTRCAWWFRSGQGPLVVLDRPPQSPPPHKTALLCTSSSGPGVTSSVVGGIRLQSRAETGTENVTQVGQGSLKAGLEMTDTCASPREVWRQVSHNRASTAEETTQATDAICFESLWGTTNKHTITLWDNCGGLQKCLFLLPNTAYINTFLMLNTVQTLCH